MEEKMKLEYSFNFYLYEIHLTRKKNWIGFINSIFITWKSTWAVSYWWSWCTCNSAFISINFISRCSLYLCCLNRYAFSILIACIFKRQTESTENESRKHDQFLLVWYLDILLQLCHVLWMQLYLECIWIS
jgi:hypothetical protein